MRFREGSGSWEAGQHILTSEDKVSELPNRTVPAQNERFGS